MSTITYTAAQVLAPESSALFGELVHLLDLSFANDPMTNWLFKNYNHKQYLEKLTHYHRFLFRTALLSGATVITIRADTSNVVSQKSTNSRGETSYKAIAILIPPSGNTTFESIFTHFRAGIVSFAWNAGFAPTSRLMFDFVPKLNNMVAEMYPSPTQHLKREQWHLLTLAARPDCQGQGLGKKLMLECQAVVTEAALEAKMMGRYVSPLYLESSTVGSKRLYNRMGFVDRGSMKYGEVKEGETVSTDEDGKVSGAQMFALTWTP